MVRRGYFKKRSEVEEVLSRLLVPTSETNNMNEFLYITTTFLTCTHHAKKSIQDRNKTKNAKSSIYDYKQL